MQLETRRLILREFKKTDWKSVHEYASDPDVSRYMEWGPNTVDDTVRFVETSVQQQKEKPRRTFEFAVTLKETGEVIGGCGMRLLPYDARQAEFGYIYNKKYWRQGIGSEACAALLKLGFTEFNLHRMYATCDAENLGSAGVLKKCGMRHEGHFLKDKFIKGNWRDTLLFAVLKEEWDAQ